MDRIFIGLNSEARTLRPKILFFLKSMRVKFQRAAVLSNDAYCILRYSVWNVCFNLKRDIDFRVYQRREVRDHLIRNASCIPADARCVQSYAPMKSLWQLWSGRGWPSQNRFASWRGCDRTASRTEGPFGILLFRGDIGLDQEAARLAR